MAFPTPPGEDIINSWYPMLFALICGVLYAIRAYFRGPRCSSTAKLDGKTVIVTGANCGIGFETAKEFAARGGRVILACRNEAAGEEAVAAIKTATKTENAVSMKLDLASFESIRQFVEEFKKNEKKLDILVNNAGIMMHPQAASEDGFELHFAVNFLGPFYLTHLLLDLLKKSQPSRVVNLTAVAYQLGKINFEDINLEKEFNASNAYSQSKLANLLFTLQLNKYLEGSGVTTYAVHPGIVNSDAHRHMEFRKSKLCQISFWPLLWLFMKKPSDGAQTVLFCCLDSTISEASGKYFVDCAEGKVSENALDEAGAKKLWDLGAKLTGLSLDEIPSKKDN